MDDTFTLKCGRVLHLKPVGQSGLRNLILKFGPGTIRNPESILQLNGTALVQALRDTEQLFNYCVGWGVTDDPPEEDLELLRETGFPVARAQTARVNWLRFLLLEDDEEAGALIAAVMVATFAPPKPEPETADSEVERLEAQVAELQARLFEMAEKESDGG